MSRRAATCTCAVVGCRVAAFVAALSSVCFVTTTAVAQTVYRCGDGRSYTQAPCADGRKVDASDPRTPEQRAEASRASARTRALADNMERERRSLEASQRTATAAATFKAGPASPASAPTRHIVRRRVVR